MFSNGTFEATNKYFFNFMKKNQINMIYKSQRSWLGKLLTHKNKIPKKYRINLHLR